MNFFAELKRRNVYKVAVAYAVVAWLLDSGRVAGSFRSFDVADLGDAAVIVVIAASVFRWRCFSPGPSRSRPKESNSNRDRA